MLTTPTDDSLFFVWEYDDIDTSSIKQTDNPQPLYVCMLCHDTDGKPDVIRGYSPADGIFERPGTVVESLSIDVPPSHPYAREIEAELLVEFETRRESMIIRGEN